MSRTRRRKRNVHVVPAGGRRFVARLARGRILSPSPVTQEEAVAEAIPEAQARRSEVIIHRPNGRIRDSDSYGHDPESARDTKH